MRWALAIAVLGSTLMAQQPEIRLLARPAQPVFHLGETVELEVACVAAVQTNIADLCDRAVAQAIVNPAVRDITRPIETTWIRELLTPCVGSGSGIGVGFGCGMPSTIGPTPHWHKIRLGPQYHISSDGTFEIEVRHQIRREPEESNAAAVELSAKTVVFVVDDPAWTGKRLKELDTTLRGGDKTQTATSIQELAELEGERAMRAQAEYVPADDANILIAKLENSTDQALASSLLRDLLLAKDVRLSLDLLLEVAAMQARLEYPDSFEEETHKPYTSSAVLEMSALQHLRENLHATSRHGQFTVDRAVQFATIIKELEEQRCDSKPAFLSAEEAGELLEPLAGLRFQ